MSAGMRVGTIIARNYLAYARTFAASFAEHHPDGHCWVLVVDDPDRTVASGGEPFEVVYPEELGIERFDAMPAMYDVTELSTAVKPWFLRWMLERSDGAPVSYFDPDIRFFAPVDDIDALARESGVVLTPHVVDALPQDGEQPRDIDILASGVFNLGFIAVGPGAPTDELLDWWSERLRYDCVIDHALGHFVDQRWFDLVPAMVPEMHLLREPNVNVGYWNLHSRELGRQNGHYVVNDQPLRFFHFSGFDPDRPEVLSKHQSRTRLADHSALARLCAEYASELQANGHAEHRSAPYPYEGLADGTRLDKRLRRLYRDGEREGAFRRSPFTAEGTEEFLDWVNEPVDPGAAQGVTRLFHDLYDERPDLKGAWPNLSGEDGRSLVDWVHERGRHDFDLPDSVLTREPDREPEGEEELGVNVVGYLRAELGVGEAARQVIKALDARGVPVVPVQGGDLPVNPQGHASREGHDFPAVSPDSAPFGVNIVCVNADDLPLFARGPSGRLMAENYSVGYWWWEVSTFPEEWTPSFDLVDEVWVGTRHVAEAVEAASPVPVVRMPIPVVVPEPPRQSRSELGLPEGFAFLFVFDYLSVFERKNPLGAVESFRKAFPEGSGASLVIKTINHEADRDNHDRLLLAAGEHADVHVVDHYVSAAAKDAMIASCDCYVSLHRAEGFGLTPAEAMALGRPVIATGYSGNLDFMTPANSWLVDYELRPIGPGNTPYPAEGEWAQPDTDSAAQAMRSVFDQPDEAAARAERGAREIARSHSPEAAGTAMERRLRWIAARSSRPPAVEPAAGSSTAVRALVEQGPWAPEHSPLGPVGKVARQAMLRLMRPYTAYEQSVDQEIDRALSQLTARVEQMEADRRRAGLGMAEALFHARRQAEQLRRRDAGG